MNTRLTGSLALLAMIVGTAFAAETNVLEKAKCLISGKEVVAESATDYKEGKVYFCCTNCPEAFKKDTAKFAAKANHQLVLTGQYKQEKCPLSGQDVNAEKTVKVSDVQVSVCCDNCLKKANETKPEEQVALLFSDKAFEKGYKPVKAEN